uniref:Col_cuticle_N domain-containing protein n=1 Tax=Caenorhabditis tropicalis TaxID=1561998 RepID=A0A1I7TIP2_9PELO
MSKTSEFFWKFRFIADFAAIGTLCFMAIMTFVIIYLTNNIIDEIDEVRDVFMRKKQTFEMYANDAENLMNHNRHLDGFSDVFDTLIRIPRQSSNTCN